MATRTTRVPIIISTLEAVPGFTISEILGVAVVQPSIYGFANPKKPLEIWESIQDSFGPVVQEMGGDAVVGAQLFSVDNKTSHPEARMYGTVVRLKKSAAKR
jgi:uncharacterized protein YbjQ (UPF0145 family)